MKSQFPDFFDSSKSKFIEFKVTVFVKVGFLLSKEFF